MGGIVTVIAVIGIMPYISLQLRAVSTTVTVLAPDLGSARLMLPMLGDTAALVAVVLAAFAILFGTRRIDAADRHEGVVLAVAFESVVKLAAFLAVGLFVTFALFEGPGDLFAKAGARADLRGLFTLPGGTGLVDWVALILLSFLMALCLPRQFQMTVVENVDERHVGQSAWRFPLYLFLINLFVLPIALAGRLIFDASVDPDTYVLALPLAGGRRALAVLAFLGGLSAAASMVIVETIALSTMVCNDLVMPVLLRLSWLGVARRSDVSALLVAIRRWTIAAMVLLGYLYVRLIGDAYPLTTIGLVSFCAAAQFAPALLGGMIWKGATRAGALAGLVSGFLVWLYTLFLPSLALSGVLPVVFAGGAGLGWARPDALFGLEGMSPITHALVWSLLANIGAFGLVSLLTRAGPLELIQAALFVAPDIGAAAGPRFTRGTAPVNELMAVVTRFLGREAADRAFADFAYSGPPDKASADLLVFAERLLAGAIGAASARVTIATVV